MSFNTRKNIRYVFVEVPQHYQHAREQASKYHELQLRSTLSLRTWPAAGAYGAIKQHIKVGLGDSYKTLAGPSGLEMIALRPRR